MATSDQPQALGSSALGTKEYWDDIYAVEIKNHSENPEDPGAIWFSDSGAEEKMLEYLEGLELDYSDTQTDKKRIVERRDIRILDLGTGNGHMLFALRDEGWKAEMLGVDYSAQSVDLARRIHAQRIENGEDTKSGAEKASEEGAITFERFDILEERAGPWLRNGFDIVLDKGTFDAISLNDATDADGRKGYERYGESVVPLMRSGGFFLITSCNWTEQELRKWFVSSDLEYHGRINYRSFTFGGVKGQAVSSICFRRSSR